MRKLARAVAVGVLGVFAAGSASAAPVPFEGTLLLDIGEFPSLVVTGAAVATINGSAGGSHLTQVRIDGGIGPGNDTVAVTDPLITAAGLISIRMLATVGSGTLGNLSTASLPLTPRDLTIMGNAALCIAAGCRVSIELALLKTTDNGEQIGVGIGGLLTVGGYAGLRISAEMAPWTIQTRTITGIPGDQVTPGGMQTVMSFSDRGFRHGPSSNTTSTARPSGVVSFLAPVTVLAEGIPGNGQRMALFSHLTLHFIPEPGVMLLLGSGIVGLVMLGRHRMRA